MGHNQAAAILKISQDLNPEVSSLVQDFHRLLAELRRCSEVGNLNAWRRNYPKIQAVVEAMAPKAGLSLARAQLKNLERQLLGNLKQRAERYAEFFFNESTQSLKASDARASVESFKIAQSMRNWSQRLEAQLKGI